jgi:GT2 family glycosyltransferase
MRPEAPTVSVIVPHFEDLRSLDLCLTALTNQTLPRDAYEIIVADNASPAGVEAVEAAIAGRARLVVVTERGAGPARNGGVAVAQGGMLAFTDADCRPEPGWLAGGVRALSEYDFVGGRVKVLVDDVDHMSPTEAFEYLFAFNNYRYVTQKGFTVTAGLFCRRELFEKVGGFLAGLPEDMEWSQRAVRAGYRLGYAADAVVGHPARKTWDELVKKWRRMNREGFLFHATTRSSLVIYAMRALLLPLSAIAHTPRVLFSRQLIRFSDKMSAIGVLYRLRAWRLLDTVRLLTTHTAKREK